METKASDRASQVSDSKQIKQYKRNLTSNLDSSQVMYVQAGVEIRWGNF